MKEKIIEELIMNWTVYTFNSAITVSNIDPDFISEEMLEDAISGLKGVSLHDIVSNISLDMSGCFFNIDCIERDNWNYCLNTEDNSLNIVIEYYDENRPELDSKQVCVSFKDSHYDFEECDLKDYADYLDIDDIYETINDL